jgi:hypothetical protein
MMKPISYYNSFWYRFTKPMKRWYFRLLLKQNKLVTVDSRHRGVGKTYMLIDRAMKLNAPIIVGNQEQLSLIKRSANTVEVCGIAKNYTKEILRYKFPNGVLIDDSVDPEMIPFIRANYKILGGFMEVDNDEN